MPIHLLCSFYRQAAVVVMDTHETHLHRHRFYSLYLMGLMGCVLLMLYLHYGPSIHQNLHRVVRQGSQL